jgi:methionine-rich copper-binding protein CopC
MRPCCLRQGWRVVASPRLVCWLGVLSVLVLLPVSLAAHTTLGPTRPAAGAVVAQPPRAVQFWFTEPIERTHSRIEVFRVALDPTTGDVTPGQRIDQGWLPGPRAAREVGVRLPEALTAGRYLVQWVIVAIDAHRLQGTFTFTYDPSAAPSGSSRSRACEAVPTGGVPPPRGRLCCPPPHVGTVAVSRTSRLGAAGRRRAGSGSPLCTSGSLHGHPCGSTGVHGTLHVGTVG